MVTIMTDDYDEGDRVGRSDGDDHDLLVLCQICCSVAAIILITAGLAGYELPSRLCISTYRRRCAKNVHNISRLQMLCYPKGIPVRVG